MPKSYEKKTQGIIRFFFINKVTQRTQGVIRLRKGELGDKANSILRQKNKNKKPNNNLRKQQGNKSAKIQRQQNRTPTKKIDQRCC